jgi:ribosomal protein S18 acetylase RimI-like enzyme
MIEIVPFDKKFIPQAAGLFVENFRKLRRAVPILPDRWEQSETVCDQMEELFSGRLGVAALADGQLVGFMGWLLAPHFHEAGRTGAYCPEWGHTCVENGKTAIYRALYRAASTLWAAAGCQVHAITLLAGDSATEKAWFWNGFGLMVVDALRPLTSLGCPAPRGLEIRKAAPADAGRLSVLDTEHWRHYSQPPVLMAERTATDLPGFISLLQDERNSVWLALDGKDPVGFMRFEGSSFGAADVVNAESTTAITGAYVRPAYRGRGAAPALLDAALRDYAARGYERCSVDFEAFNPEAAAFWMRYFESVCLSVTRIPEIS